MKRNRTLRSSSKGNAGLDGVTWLILIVVFVFFGLIGLIVLTNVNDAIQIEPELSEDAKGKMQDLDNRLPTWVDGITLFLAIMLWLGVLIASIFINTRPVFFIVVFLVGAILMILAMSIGNLYEDLQSDADVVSVVNELPITNFIFSHLAEYSLILIFTIGVVLYAKFRS